MWESQLLVLGFHPYEFVSLAWHSDSTEKQIQEEKSQEARMASDYCAQFFLDGDHAWNMMVERWVSTCTSVLGPPMLR